MKALNTEQINQHGPFFISRSSDRSANAMQEGSDDIDTYICTTFDPSESDTFDRWANTSESMVGEFETTEEIIEWFEDEMADRPTFRHYFDEKYTFDVDNIRGAFQDFDFDENQQTSSSAGECDDDGVIFEFTAYAARIENDFYTIEDPDGVQDDYTGLYPEPKPGVSILWDNETKVTQSDLWNELVETDEIDEFIAENYDDPDDITDLDPDDDLWEDFIEAVESAGYKTEHASSPGHLDSSSSPGTGAVYDVVFIKRA